MLAPLLRAVSLAPGAREDLSVAVAASRTGGLGRVDLEPRTDPVAARRLVCRLAPQAGLQLAVKLGDDALDVPDWLVAEVPEDVRTVMRSAGARRGALRRREGLVVVATARARWP